MAQEQQNPGFEQLHQSIEAVIIEGRQKQSAFGLEAAETHYTSLLRKIRICEVAALNEKGLVYRMQNRYSKAEAEFKTALSISDQNNDIDGKAVALASILDLKRTGQYGGPDYEQDLPLAKIYKIETQKVLDRMPAEPPRISRVVARIQIGLFEHDTKQYSKALEIYNLADKELRSLIMKDPNNTYFKNRESRIATIKGNTLEDLGQSEEAFAEQMKAWENCTELNDVRGQTNAARSMAQMLRDDNKTDEARKWFQIALEMALRVGDRNVINLATQELKELDSK